MPELFGFHPLHLLLLVTILQRIGEFLASRKNQRRLRAAGAVEYGAAHYPVLALFYLLWLTGMVFEAVWIPRTISPFWLALLAIWLFAEIVRFMTIRALGSRWTTRVLVLPNEEPVTTGPFRYLRHPTYFVTAIEIAVLPLMFGCYITAVTFSIVGSVMMFVRIRSENLAWKEVSGSL